MRKPTVIVTDHDFDNLEIEREVLGDIADVRDAGAATNGRSTIDQQLAEADAVLNLRYEIDRNTIDRMTNCRIIARYGIGVDNIDLEAATANGIDVTNVPDYCQEEVATHAMTVLLSLYRGVTRYDDSVASGAWDRDVATPIHRLSTQTLGIVGFGAIGREVATRAAPYGFDIVASDPFVDAETAANHGAELIEFDTLLEQVDAITIHSPLTPETRGLFDADAFATMRDSALLVNVARGPIVEEDALRSALLDGTIGGAGLDVFADEPPTEENSLRSHERVITTPHVAWYSEEANDERRRKAAENVRDALQDQLPKNVVNNE